MDHIKALAKSLAKQEINVIKAKLPIHIERDADRFLKEKFYSHSGLSYMEETAVGLVLAENMPVDRWSLSPQGRRQQANSILEKQQEINQPLTSRTYANNDIQFLYKLVEKQSLKQEEIDSNIKDLLNTAKNNQQEKADEPLWEEIRKPVTPRKNFLVNTMIYFWRDGNFCLPLCYEELKIWIINNKDKMQGYNIITKKIDRDLEVESICDNDIGFRRTHNQIIELINELK